VIEMTDKLSEAEIEHIAERAAEKALEKVYQQIGKNVAHKILWFLGAAAVGLLMLFSGKDLIR